MPASRTSPVWEYFIESDGKARCILCGTIMSYCNNNGSNLRRHLRTKHPTINLKTNPPKRIEEIEEEDMAVDNLGICEDSTEQPSTSEDPVRVSKLKRSPVWEYFKMGPNKTSTCSICKHTFATIPSNLRRHLKNKHPTVGSESNQNTSNDEEVEEEMVVDDLGLSDDSIELPSTSQVSVSPPSRKTSLLWDHFTDVEPNKTAFCSICRIIFTYNNSESYLRNHLKSKHPTVNLEPHERATNTRNEIKQPTVALETRLLGPYSKHEIETMVLDGIPAPTEQPSSSQVRDHLTRKTSFIWDYFTEEEPEKARCSICNKTLSIANSCFSNLRRHMKSKHPTVNAKARPRPTENLEQEIQEMIVFRKNDSVVSSEPPPTAQQFIRKTIPASRRNQLDNQLLKTIAKEYYPFKMVEDVEFQNFVQMLNPAYKLPTRKNLSTLMLPAMYQNTLELVKNEVTANADYVSITTDSWTSIKNQAYIAVTVHYISRENCQLKSYLIGCIQYTNQHTSVDLHQLLCSLIREWGLEGKVVAATTDNAPKLVAAVQHSWSHVGCFAHTLNIIVQRSLVAVSTTRNKVNRIVEHFKRSTSALAKLNEMQETLGMVPVLGLVQDEVTRWNSTLHMFQCVLKLKTPLLSTLDDVNCGIALTSADWDIVAQCCEILQIFEQMSIEVSAEKGVTISKVGMFARAMLHHCETVRNNQQLMPEITELASTLYDQCQDGFHEYAINTLLHEASLLDPRFKKFAFEDNDTFEEAKAAIIANGSSILESNNATPSDETNTSACSSLTSSGAATFNISNSYSLWEDFDEKVSSLSKDESHATSRIVIEVDKYLLEPIIPRSENPLAWWELNKKVYPTLYTLMKRRLSIQATSVPSERLFSKTGEIMKTKRSRLTSKRLEELVFLNYNLK
uniref:Zinc finger BED domain-containing protein 1 n=1 Tax=Cacopsylla melanoneura TaxID=428564 RepID=A0A8D8YQC9_9HEMI